MVIKALIGFAGIETMSAGEEKEVTAEIGKDLIKAGYAIEVKKKGGKKVEDK